MEFIKSLGEIFSLTFPVSPSSVEFLDVALTSTTGTFALSYSDPDQICLIRKHVICLLQDHPSFKPSLETFVYNNGTTVNLLTANGQLQVCSSAPDVSVKVLVHENYPRVAPVVYVVPESGFGIFQNHPFVDSCSGATSCSYLENWHYPGCNLSGLVQNLIKLFSCYHPFHYTSSSLSHPSLVSKREAMDRLTCALYYDIIDLSSRAEVEISELSNVQAEISKRAESLELSVLEHEEERTGLRECVRSMTDDADRLLSWLKVHNQRCVASAVESGDIEDVFEGIDEISTKAIVCLSGERAIEDSIEALDKALELGVVSSGVYVKQVRSLAREQFLYRAKLLKLGVPIA